MVWFWIALVIIVILLVLASWIHIHVHFHKHNKDDLLELKIKAVYGLLRLRFKIPAIQIKQDGMEIKTEEEDTLTSQKKKKKKHMTLQTLYQSILDARLLMQNIKGFMRWLTRTLWHIRCTRLEWSTRVGFGDASDTAIITGALLSLKWTCAGAVANFIQLHTEPKIFVTPEYNQSTFDMEMQCIVKIRFGYAIVAGVQFLIRIAKVKGGFRIWKNTLFKA